MKPLDLFQGGAELISAYDTFPPSPGAVLAGNEAATGR